MTAVQADAFPVASPRRSHSVVTVLAIACALLLAIAALTVSLVALNDEVSVPAPRVAAIAIAPAQVPVCPMHGRC